jgi:hypothetical protein
MKPGVKQNFQGDIDAPDRTALHPACRLINVCFDKSVFFDKFT